MRFHSGWAPPIDSHFQKNSLEIFVFFTEQIERKFTVFIYDKVIHATRKIKCILYSRNSRDSTTPFSYYIALKIQITIIDEYTCIYIYDMPIKRKERAAL